jgi:cyclophilin family peptidyl-prolyl cis-trans isomerase
MSNRRTRDRQLAKLADRRRRERQRQYRRRMITTLVVVFLVLGAMGTALYLLTQGGSSAKPAASASPTPSASAVPGSDCIYVPKADENTGKKGVQPPPPFTIKAEKSYTATVQTSMGTFTAELFAKDAPCAVNSFVSLAKGGFFNGLTFHRIVKDFVIQGGDPAGDGSGGPGYTFNDELNNGHAYEVGTLAMANSGPNTNGSQWFVVTGEQGVALPNQYTIFGKVTKGMDVVTKISEVPVNGQTPVDKVTIEKVTVKPS